MRPAVSVGRTTALDGFTNNHSFSHLSNLDADHLSQHDFSGYFDAPQPTESDNYIFENGVLPVADNFNLNLDHMVGYNDGVLNDFNLDEFIHNDDQPAPETQSSDSLAKTTASLQPQLGASLEGLSLIHI